MKHFIVYNNEGNIVSIGKTNDKTFVINRGKNVVEISNEVFEGKKLHHVLRSNPHFFKVDKGTKIIKKTKKEIQEMELKSNKID